MRYLLMIAFLVGQYQTGMTKQCVYNGFGNQYVITIDGYKIRPYSINIQRGGYESHLGN